MATKTISIDLEAYHKLSRARKTPKESFSQVIRRATWPAQAKTCGSFLRSSLSLPGLPENVIKRLDLAQEGDAIPESKWSD